jgi:hypothetical protein
LKRYIIKSQSIDKFACLIKKIEILNNIIWLN